MYSFPHRFWTVSQGNRKKGVVESDDSLHLVASVWDMATETVLPIDTSRGIRNEDGLVTEQSPWPMLSQSMGFHYGDDVTLSGEGAYTATLRVSPMQTKRTGAFQGEFTEAQTVESPFEFDTDEAYDPLGSGRIVVEEAGGPAEGDMQPDGDVPESQTIIDQGAVSYSDFRG